MNRLLFLICILVFSVLQSQSKITVYTSDEHIPIPNATVKCRQKIVGKTDKNGILNFKTGCKKVEVSAEGFYPDEVVVDKVMEISLSEEDPNVRTIEAIVLKDESDPKALAILDKVNENYHQNSPKTLDSYSFKSYEKISYDFDEDSIRAYNIYLQKRMDSLKKLPELDLKKQQKKDSLEAVNMAKLMGNSKLFLWERAQKFLYSKNYGEKILVLDNRVSGLKEPMYEMMTLRSNRTKIPKEIAKENRSLYRYFLTDTIDIEGRKNYVIRFRQVDYKQPVNRRKFNGYLYVDAETYGLKKIESNSKIKSEGTITSIWNLQDGKWFLSKENLKVRAGNFSFNEPKKADSVKLRKKFGTYIFMTSDYFDFRIPAEAEKKDFKGYTVEIRNSDGSLLNDFRTMPLSEREKQTYVKIDSVGSKYKIDQKANVFSALLKGKLRMGNVDLDLSQIVKYNLYEGFRLGAGIKFNERFNRYISPDGYVAYGFKDGAFKYGIGLDIKTTTAKNSYFRMEYYNDVLASGKFSENMWNFRMKLMNSGVDLKNDRFYRYQGFRVSYENDLTNTLTMKISAKRNEEEAKFGYNYKNLGGNFKNFSTMLTLKYSPNSKNMMTPSGKYTYEQNYPEFYFNFEKSFVALGGAFDYSRMDFLAAHQLKWKAGVTGLRLYAGLLNGDAPIWHHFQANGLSSGDPQKLNFNLTSYLGFATMEAGKYYNDKFAGFYLTHRIPWYFRSFGKNISSFDLVYRGIIGNMKNTEFHDFQFEKLNHFYQEAGLEWNNFLSSQFNLGVFYRIGYYHTDVFKENFAVQFKFKFLGF